MIKEALAALRDAAQSLKRTPAHLLVFVALYLLLVVACHLFITTRVATVPQLIVTALTALTAPLLFFMLQAASVDYTRTASSTNSLLRRAAGDFPKIILASIPLILLGIGLVYLINKLQVQFPVPLPTPVITNAIAVEAPVPFAWSEFLFFALRLFLLGILLPLLAIHTWLSVARRGLVATMKNLFGVLRSTFAARSLLIYTFGLLIFAGLPYFLIFTRTPVSQPWTELSIFGLRLFLVFALTLFGWVVTIGALAKTAYDSTPPIVPDTTPTAAAPAVIPSMGSTESAPATP